MGVVSSMLALADVIDPTQAYWSILMRSGKVWSEHSLVPTLRRGVRGVRLLDWGDDIVSTGDVHRVKEIRMHLPVNRDPSLGLPPLAVLEIGDGMEPFQFKRKSLNMIGSWATRLEFMVIGRVVDKASGSCECFIWDYNPVEERQHKDEVPYKAAIPAIGDSASSDFIPGIPGVTHVPEVSYRAAGPNFIAYRSNIRNFGAWRESLTPLGALAIDVQGFRL